MAPSPPIGRSQSKRGACGYRAPASPGSPPTCAFRRSRSSRRSRRGPLIITGPVGGRRLTHEASPGSLRLQFASHRAEDVPMKRMADGRLDPPPQHERAHGADVSGFEADSGRAVRELEQCVAPARQPDPSADGELLFDDVEPTMPPRVDQSHALEQVSPVVNAFGLVANGRPATLGA